MSNAKADDMVRILVIDDEADLLEEIVDFLHFSDYEARGVLDSSTALEVALDFQPDVIICDVMMPRLDGYGVLLAIRSHAETATTPFIFLTALTDYESMRLGMQQGADDYLHKPFSFQDLQNAITTQLEKASLRRAAYAQQMDTLRQQAHDNPTTLTQQDEFLAMMLHDCKTPISAMLSSTQLIKRYRDRLSEAHQLQHLDNVERQIFRLTNLLDDFKWLMQSESQMRHDTTETLDFAQLCASITQDFDMTHNDHSIRFIDDTDAALLTGQPLALERMVTNLVANAVKYSPDGGCVTVHLDQAPAQLVLRVEDDGIGIPPDDLSRLFKAFQRGSNVAGITGTGLGLSIVKQAAEAHAGTVDVESIPQEGTTFTVYLPTG